MASYLLPARTPPFRVTALAIILPLFAALLTSAVPTIASHHDALNVAIMNVP